MSYGWHGGVCRFLFCFLFVLRGWVGGGGGGLYLESTVSVVTDETAKSSRYDMNKSTNISYYACVAFHVIVRVWLSHGIFNEQWFALSMLRYTLDVSNV